MASALWVCACGNEATLQCSRCSAARYCSKACQEQQRPLHREQCDKERFNAIMDALDAQSLIVLRQVLASAVELSAETMPADKREQTIEMIATCLQHMPPELVSRPEVSEIRNALRQAKCDRVRALANNGL